MPSHFILNFCPGPLGQGHGGGRTSAHYCSVKPCPPGMRNLCPKTKHRWKRSEMFPSLEILTDQNKMGLLHTVALSFLSQSFSFLPENSPKGAIKLSCFPNWTSGLVLWRFFWKKCAVGVCSTVGFSPGFQRELSDTTQFYSWICFKLLGMSMGPACKMYKFQLLLL